MDEIIKGSPMDYYQAMMGVCDYFSLAFENEWMNGEHFKLLCNQRYVRNRCRLMVDWILECKKNNNNKKGRIEPRLWFQCLLFMIFHKKSKRKQLKTVILGTLFDSGPNFVVTRRLARVDLTINNMMEEEMHYTPMVEHIPVIQENVKFVLSAIVDDFRMNST